MSCYASISEFGASSQSATSNPLSVCAVSGLDAGFNNKLGRTILSPDGGQCQAFMAQYCATAGWDGVCEYKSKDIRKTYPNTQQNCSAPGGSCLGSGIGTYLTAGQTLIRNTAAEKYLTAVSDHCRREYQPFDPTDASSPLISNWVAQGNDASCVMIYDVNPTEINNDPVMNKILDQPWIAMDILMNIYNHRKNKNMLHQLSNTKLGHFFASEQFRKIVSAK